MRKIVLVSAVGSMFVGGLFILGCGNPNMSGTGGPGGYHSSSSEQNVGSRSSHGLYGGTVDQTGTAGGNTAGNAPSTPYSQNQTVSPNSSGNNGVSGNSADIGTSQQNSGSSSNGGTARPSGSANDNGGSNSGSSNAGSGNANSNNGSNANGPTNSNTGGQLGTPPAAPRRA